MFSFGFNWRKRHKEKIKRDQKRLVEWLKPVLFLIQCFPSNTLLHHSTYKRVYSLIIQIHFLTGFAHFYRNIFTKHFIDWKKVKPSLVNNLDTIKLILNNQPQNKKILVAYHKYTAVLVPFII